MVLTVYVLYVLRVLYVLYVLHVFKEVNEDFNYNKRRTTAIFLLNNSGCSFVHSFIADIYIAPLQVGLLRVLLISVEFFVPRYISGDGELSKPDRRLQLEWVYPLLVWLVPPQ